MAGRRYRRPPSLNLSFSSRESSPSSSKSPSPEPYSEDEALTAAPRTTRPYRPMSMAFNSSGPYCIQPTLSDILSNTAPAPYTLSAFMAFLSQNHCLETLEFTMDAGRYKKHWRALTPPPGCAPPSPDSDGYAYVRMLWRKLLDAYIVPNGPREVNLPCSVRDQILSAPNHHTPPPPEVLDPAVNIVYELMQESVLIPFVNECQHAGAYSLDSAPPLQPASRWGAQHADEDPYMRGSLDERLLRRRRDPSPPMPMDFVSHSYSHNDSHTRRAASPFSASLGWHRQSAHVSTNSWASGSGDSMVEDSGSSTPSFGTPMTPPTTPPTSEAILPAGTGGSPRSRSSTTTEKGWKKVSGGLVRGFGWNKKKGSGEWSGSF